MYGSSKVRVDELVVEHEATEKKCDRERTADVVGLEREKLVEGGRGAADAGEQEGEGRGGKGMLQVDALAEERPQEDAALDEDEDDNFADTCAGPICAVINSRSCTCRRPT